MLFNEKKIKFDIKIFFKITHTLKHDFFVASFSIVVFSENKIIEKCDL